MIAAALIGFLTGCGPTSLVARAIEARGGPMRGWVRNSVVEVKAGFPGEWTWRTAYLAPDSFAWEIDTAAGRDRYLLDGQAVRSFVGDRLVSADSRRSGPIWDQARLAAIAGLDVLETPGVRLEPIAPADLPEGVESGLVVHLPGDENVYRLGFDAALRVVWVAGSADIPPFGRGELTLRQADHRRVGGLLLPFSTLYVRGGRLLAEEHARALCPDPPGLDARSFTEANALPACEPPLEPGGR